MHLPDCFLEESEARVPSMMEACRPGDALSFYARKPMYFSTGRCKVTVLGFGYQIYQSQILHGICNFWHAAIEAIWQLNAFPSNSYSWIHHASSSSSRFGQSSSTRNSAGVSSHIYSLAKIHLFLLEMERSKPLNLLFWGQYSNVSSAWGWLASACLWKSRALDYIDLGSFATDFGILSFGIHFGRESEWTAYSTISFVLDIITVRIVGISFALNIWLYGVCFLWFACHLLSRFLDVLSAHP